MSEVYEDVFCPQCAIDYHNNGGELVDEIYVEEMMEEEKDIKVKWHLCEKHRDNHNIFTSLAEFRKLAADLKAKEA